MQFLWKYIDDLVGKGLEWSIIGELLVYQSATLLPLALPLAVLVSSIMTFGALGEKYELIALKASGVSLIKVMSPLIVFMSIISIGAFLFANYVIPVANLKSSALLFDITRQKPTLNLREGVFFTGIDGYSIKVGKKEKDGKLLKDIIIYDHSQGRGKSKMIIAKYGSMVNDEGNNRLILSLEDGKTFEDLKRGNQKKNASYPFARSSFKKERIVFDLSDFAMERTKEELFKDHYKMMSVGQLDYSIDSLQIKLNAKKVRIKNKVLEAYTQKQDSTQNRLASIKPGKGKSFISGLEHNKMIGVLETAVNLSRSAKTYYKNSHRDINSRGERIVKHYIEWHRKFVLSLACLVLFFIGAPLGAIIRKGGLGMPFVISVLLFIVFHVISLIGEKMTRGMLLEPLVGMWIATFILLPVGIFLTYKSNSDSALFNLERYTRPIQILLSKLNLHNGKS
ncbi:MAG: lipopolysaccharide export system permease protein [Flavobacteriales bacterium]|jgi:lipopolysaccharide export system permease protein